MGYHRSFKLAVATTMLLGAPPVAAQDWPTRNVTLVVPFGAGSATDTVSRIIGARMSELMGQQIIVENVGGAGGMIGVSRVAKANADGYTIALGAVDTFAQSQTLYAKPLYDSMKEFAPVALAVEQPLLLITRKELPPNNLKEFSDYVKANHGKMQFGSAGVGSAPHLVCSQITHAIGVSVPHVPYRSSAPALQDLIAGTLDFYCPLAPAATGLIENKQIKAIAVLTKERSPLLPNLPSAAEQGMPGIDGYYWMGYFLPKGTPDSIVTKLNGIISQSLDTPTVAARLRDVGTSVVAPQRRTSAYLQKYVEDEIKQWAATIKASGVKLN